MMLTTRCSGSSLSDPAVLLEAEAVDILHRQVGEFVLDHGVVDPHDIRVVEATGDHPLVLEQLAHAPRHGRAILAETNDFDRNLPRIFRVVTKVDRSGRSPAELADDAVFAYRFHDIDVE